MATTEDRWTSRDLAVRIARLAEEKQAERIVVLKMAEALQVTDYFVICDGHNRRHLSTIAEFVAKELKHVGLHRMGGSPMKDDNWVLLDFGPVVLHVFAREARGYYDLENLWGDCPRVRWQPRAPKPAAEDAPAASPAPPEDDAPPNP